jgi:hypothetical protein
MATVELYPDVENVFVQFADDDTSVESDYTDHQNYDAGITILKKDRSHTAAVMDTDKSA